MRLAPGERNPPPLWQLLTVVAFGVALGVWWPLLVYWITGGPVFPR